MRRGEGQFIAIEVGLRHDPKVLGLALALKITRAEAVGYLAAWREFVLTRGTGAGTVAGYTEAELVCFLEWTGPPKRIVAAFKAAGFLVTRRKSFVYPHWPETVTGFYAHRRARDRDRKAAEREGGEEERPGTSGGMSADIPRNGHGTSGGKGTVSKTFHGTPPGVPQGGPPDVASRLEWFEDNYPKGLVETEKCAALLGALSDAEWAHLQHAVQTSSRSIWWRERGRAPKPEKWLADQEWRRTKVPKPVGRSAKIKRADRPAEPDPSELERMRLAFVRRADIRDRLKAEGVPKSEIEDRIDRELAEDVAAAQLPS